MVSVYLPVRKEELMMNSRKVQLLKLSFTIGTIADGIVAINWFVIASGISIPNMLSGYSESGIGYQFAMYIAAIFMTGWTVILFWGLQKPEERKDLLIITAVLLLISIILELIFFQEILIGTAFWIGVILRLLLIAKFSFSYFYSFQGK